MPVCCLFYHYATRDSWDKVKMSIVASYSYSWAHCYLIRSIYYLFIFMWIVIYDELGIIGFEEDCFICLQGSSFHTLAF